MYTLRVTWAGRQIEQVQKRFSEFEKLDVKLRPLLEGRRLPALPGKNWSGSSKAVVDQRIIFIMEYISDAMEQCDSLRGRGQQAKSLLEEFLEMASTRQGS
jgi:hypothetical protein